ncbi:MAG TPA: glycosyltransferase [Planctomycetota bacterium]|nr:glycosyltransferase [Planctomycetota bacterium]
MAEKFLSAHVNTEPTWRGGEQQTLYLLEGLRRRGYPVVLFTAPGSPLYERARNEGIETYGLTIRSEADVLAVLRLTRVLKRLRPSLLHMHTSHAHTIGVCAAILAGNGMRRVVSRRVNFSIYRHSFFGLNWIKYCYGVDRYLTVSASVREVLVRDGVDPERIRVVHSGVDPERFRNARADQRARLLEEWQLPAGIPLVGCIGALEPYKGFEHLLEAAAEVARGRDCAYVVVGEGELYTELNRKARSLGLGHRFRLVGFRSDIGDILNALDVFVFPSLEEGLGTSLLDALLLERPTVATRTGGIPEVIRHRLNGLLVEPRDSRALAAGIEELLADPEEGRRLGSEGKQTVVECFSVDCMVEKTLQSYVELLR